MRNRLHLLTIANCYQENPEPFGLAPEGIVDPLAVHVTKKINSLASSNSLALVS